MLQANEPVRVSCPPVKDTRTRPCARARTHRLPATQADAYVRSPSQALMGVLPVACGRVSDLLEQEQGVCVSSVTGPAKISIFCQKKPPKQNIQFRKEKPSRHRIHSSLLLQRRDAPLPAEQLGSRLHLEALIYLLLSKLAE